MKAGQRLHPTTMLCSGFSCHPNFLSTNSSLHTPLHNPLYRIKTLLQLNFQTIQKEHASRQPANDFASVIADFFSAQQIRVPDASSETGSGESFMIRLYRLEALLKTYIKGYVGV
jgi:hypothetical protein